MDSRFLNIDYSALNGLWTSRFLALLESFMRDIEHAFDAPHGVSFTMLSRLCEVSALRSMSYKHLQHQVTGLASVFLNLQSSHAYGRVVSDPIEGAPDNERPLLVLRNAAGA